MARNFYYNDHNILYPQINWGGNSEGYVECEFQLYTYTVSLLYSVFGVNESLGRLLSVVLSLLLMLGLYLLIRSIRNEKLALLTVIVYALLPLNVFYNRAFMPETAMMTCSVWGIYFFYKWIQDEKLIRLFLSLIFISLAVLLKLPTLYIGLSLAFLAFTKYSYKAFIKPQLLVFALLVFVFTALWYYHAHNLFLQTGLTFGIWTAGSDKWLMLDYLIKPSFYNDLFFKSIAERHLTWAGFILFIWGLFLKRENRYEKLFDFWLISILIFFIIVQQANLAQEYYQLPFNISASFYIAKVLNKYSYLFSKEKMKQVSLKTKFAFVLVILLAIMIPVLSTLRLHNFYKQENKESAIFKLSDEVKAKTDFNDLVITVSEGNPVYLYNFDRHGWVCFTADINEAYIKEKIKNGAKYLTADKTYLKEKFNKEEISETLSKYQTITNNELYLIIKLE